MNGIPFADFRRCVPRIVSVASSQGRTRSTFSKRS
jgi:hypothetical protein